MAHENETLVVAGDAILGLVDGAIARWGAGREVVAVGEVIDLLLDIRRSVCVCPNCEEKETVSSQNCNLTSGRQPAIVAGG